MSKDCTRRYSILKTLDLGNPCDICKLDSYRLLKEE